MNSFDILHSILHITYFFHTEINKNKELYIISFFSSFFHDRKNKSKEMQVWNETVLLYPILI